MTPKASLNVQIPEDTEFPYPVYADTSRKLYQELGLISSLAGPPKDEPPKSYIGSMASVIINSTLVCVVVTSCCGANPLIGVYSAGVEVTVLQSHWKRR